jgi:hypothetical protein
MANFKLSPIIWLGSVLSGVLLLHFVTLSKLKSYQKRMNIINDIGRDVYLRLIEAGFLPGTAQYITAQSAHETSNFSSEVFKQNKNLFGYKYVGQWRAQGEKNGHAYYKSITDSIADYLYYYKMAGYPKTFLNISDFVSALKRNKYFEAPLQEYITGVKHFYNLYFNAGN